ncbi:endoribonuclease YbeY [Gammaproteobacteria bacterium]
MSIVTVKVQYAVAKEDVPQANLISQWVKSALSQAAKSRRLAAEVTVRVVGKKEITDLNHRYRHKNAPTNVLSFGYDIPPGTDLPLFGDIVICAPIAAEEAIKQGKERDAHWAHLIVHGTLHLLGFDHEDPIAAMSMEALETQILSQSGYPDPYLESSVLSATFYTP